MKLLRKSLVPTPLFNMANANARSLYHSRIAVEIRQVPDIRHRGLHVLHHAAIGIAGAMTLFLGGSLTPRAQGRLLRTFLESLGGLWIKPGQILATRRDIFHPEFCEELANLQEKVIGFPPEEAMRIVEQELGVPIAQVFSQFDEKPFAAASVGQLHKAVLRSEDLTVAVKVQRPNLESSFKQDFKFIRLIISLIERAGLARHIHWSEMGDELNRILTEEFDFRYEASNITRMRKTLRKARIYAPELFQQYCTRRVMVMEFVSGVSMADYIAALTLAPARLNMWLTENNVEPRRIGRRLFLSIYRQLLEDNLFHGDLHPGNILLLRNSRVAFLDFGTVGTLDVGFYRKYVMLQRALTSGDYSRTVDLLLLLFPPLPETIEQPRKEMITVIQSHQTHSAIKEIPYTEKTASALVSKLTAVFFKYKIPAGMDFMRIDRTMLALDASLMHLIPHENMVKLMRRYWAKADERRFRRLQRQYKAGMNSVDALTLAVDGPHRLSEILLLHAETLRGKARTIEDRLSKTSVFMAMVASLVRGLIFVSLLYMATALLVQIRRPWASAILSNRILEIVDWFPKLDTALWTLLLLFALYWFVTVGRLRRRVSRPEAKR